MANVNIKYYPNRDKVNSKTGKIPIYCRLLRGREKKEFRLPKTFDLSANDKFLWEETTQRLKQKNSQINNYLNSIDLKLQLILTCPEGGIPNLKDIAKRLQDSKKYDEEETNPQLVTYLNRYLMEEIETNTRKEGTKRNYRNAFNQLNNFLVYAKISEIRVKDFKFKHAQDFKLYLEKDFGLIKVNNGGAKKIANKEVSSSTKIKNIKPVFGKAINEGIISENPFKKVRLNHRSEKSPYLNTTELKAIYDHDFTERPELELVQDLFLFMCFTGLSITDTLTLNSDHIKEQIASRLLLEKVREKTRCQIKQILIKPAEILIKKYYQPSKPYIPTLIFPKISDVDVNRKLKLIAAHTGIKINLTTKIARITCREQIYEAAVKEPDIVNLYMGWSPTVRDKVKLQYYSITDIKLLKFSCQLEIYFHNILKNAQVIQNEIILSANKLIW